MRHKCSSCFFLFVHFQYQGWVSLSCSGSTFPSTKAGALCTAYSEPNSRLDSKNPCGTSMLPINLNNNIAIPVTIMKNYFLIQGNFTRKEAEAECRVKGAALASIKSSGEFHFISKNISKKRSLNRT